MKTILVKELMIPLKEYAHVYEDTSLYEAVIALEDAQKESAIKKHRHRAMLIFNKDEEIAGVLNQFDVLRALEPKYSEIGPPKSLSHFGFTPAFLKSMFEQFSLWSKPMETLCRKASGLKVRNFMYTPPETQYIKEDDSLDIAIHQLVMGNYQGLLVTKDGKAVGILRLVDVFSAICDSMKACKI
ncbi:MAG: CBS domain-containing protein [Deltaproteobacteria bacterium]|nr:CBS domain-containing protein [Deltaproteobacteria bacterium]